ncbi:hypothetical protein A6K25_10605 [Alteromonas stellipolaris]|jgi:hypothetical protein|nr:hypothetical protein A6K25_10605 [Alteromonas stellipolaris]
MPVAQILNLLHRKEVQSQYHFLKHHIHEMGNKIEILKWQQKFLESLGIDAAEIKRIRKL